MSEVKNAYRVATINFAPESLTYNINFENISMGNTLPSCCSEGPERHINELMSLTSKSYQSSSQVSFDPFASVCRHQNLERWRMSQNEFDHENPQMGEQTLKNNNEEVSNGSQDPIFFRENVEDEIESLQKNQRKSEKISRSKKIKKTDRSRKAREVQALESFEEMNPEEMEALENSTNAMENSGIRDQNNCKSYHKLVKNYLMSKGLGKLFDDFDIGYHTRYYFIAALIFIKYYLKENFSQTYQEIVRKELEVQRKKISKKFAQREKVQKEIRQTGKISRKYGQLIEKRKDLQKKISHIEVVIHEIEDFSIRSCRAFFSGNTEESLRILYMKDDPVMRKKYYFDSALECVIKLQIQVRQSASLPS